MRVVTMRLISYEGNNGPRVAVKVGEAYVDVQQADSRLPANMKQLLALGKEALASLERAAQSAEAIALENIRFSAPVPDPQKVICIGLNYSDHAKESGMEPPPEPVVFNKFPSSVCGHLAPIVLPGLSNQVDYEAELVAIIGTPGRDIPEHSALEHVAGYCCGHDVSARDWQLGKPGKQWLLGKTFDTFAPFGPELVTADEVPDPGNLSIQLRLNGETMQDSTTGQLIFSIAELVAYVSSVCTLLPGDVIFTGTPPGVGMARKPPVFLKPGDAVEVEIGSLGVLENHVVAGN